jgi:DNA-directed RNA polymerase specialized sigma24 family protein
VGAPPAPGPSLDDYVAARGPDLLRTAWLLTGDADAAQRLVRDALAAAWPQWEHLVRSGAGSNDRELLGLLVRRHLHGRRPAVPRDAPPDAAPTAPTAPADAQTRLLDALARLRRADRARVVLAVAEGLGNTRVAALLDEPASATRRHLRQATDLLCADTGLSLDELADALDALVPPAVPLGQLTPPPPGNQRRWRRAGGWAAVTAAALGVALTVGSLSDDPQQPTPTPAPSTTTLAFQYCEQDHPSAYPPPGFGSVSEVFAAALVCARTDVDSVWSGSLPPDDELTAPAGLDSLRLEPRGDATGCPALPRGPAFRLLLRTLDGAVVSYPNESLRCDGWLALSDYYVAVAEQRLNPQTGRGAGGYLGCPPLTAPPDRQSGTPTLPPDVRFVTATVCLHPASSGAVTQQPRFRPVRMNVLGDTQLVSLNRDLAAGAHPGPRTRCVQQGWTYVLRGLTRDGALVELANGCPDELTLRGSRTTVDLGPDTESMLRALVVAN